MDPSNDAPLYTFRVIQEPPRFFLSDPSSRLDVFRDRLELHKPALRAIPIASITRLCFDAGRVWITVGDETIDLGVSSRIAAAVTDPDETRCLAALVEGLRRDDQRLVARSLADAATTHAARRKQVYGTFGIIVFGAITATLLAQVNEMLHWIYLVIVVQAAVMLPRRAGPTITEFRQGCRDLARGDAVRAIQHFQPLVADNPTWIELYANLGLAHKHLKNYREADDCFTRVLELHPDLPNAALFQKLINDCAILNTPRR